MKITNSIFSNEVRSYKNHSIQHLLEPDETDNSIKIYTDGSFKFTNRRIIGYAFAIENQDAFYAKNGYVNVGKNKKKLGALYAETIAIEKAVEYAYKKNYNDVCIYTDNKYIISTINNDLKYINPILNAFLNKLTHFLNSHVMKLCIKYIKGHMGYLGNELVNFWARKGRKKDIISRKFYLSELMDFNSAGEPRVVE